MRVVIVLLLLAVLTGPALSQSSQPSPRDQAMLAGFAHPVLQRQLLLSLQYGHWRAASRIIEAQLPWVKAAPMDQALKQQILSSLDGARAIIDVAGGAYAATQGEVERQLAGLGPDPASRQRELGLRASLVLVGLEGARPELVRAHLEPALKVCPPQGPLAFLLATYACRFELQQRPELPTEELLRRHQQALGRLQGVLLAGDEPLEYRRLVEGLTFWELALGERRMQDPQRADLLTAMEAQGTWLDRQAGSQPLRESDRALEWLTALGFMRVDRAEWLQAHERWDMSGPILGEALANLEGLQKLYATKDEQFRGERRQAFQDIARLQAPYLRDLAAQGLAFHQGEYEFSLADGDLAWYVSRLQRAQVRQLLPGEADALSASVRTEIRERLKAARQAQEVAEANQGYGAAEDFRLVELQVELFLREGGWQDRTRTLAREALERARRYNYRPGLIAALEGSSRVQEAVGDRPGAVALQQQALGLAEQWIAETGAQGQAAQGLRASLQRQYQRLARLQVETGQAPEALSSLARGQQVEVLTAGATPSFMSRLNTLRGQGQALELEVTRQQSLGRDAGLASQLLAGNRQEFYNELNRIKTSHPQYESLLAVRPVNFAPLQKGLPGDCCLVQYLPCDQDLFIFVATASDLKIHKVNLGSRSLTEKIARYRQLVQGERQGGFTWQAAHALRDLSAELYQALIEPVEAEIQSKSVVAFIPTGALTYLPLQALGKTTPEGGLEPLICRKACVTLLKSADLESLTRPARGSQGAILALGDPDGSLPESGKEAEEVAQLFPSHQVYRQAEAARQVLKSSPGLGYLHLATHGVMDPQDPASSYLLLAGKDQLRVSDIYGLDLGDLRLVTLSACQTALARHTASGGSELITLASAFSVAGGRAVVASLWSVSDHSTRELMVRFYRGLQQGLSLAQALQKAQQGLSADPGTAHPFYWAPFVLIGDWR